MSTYVAITATSQVKTDAAKLKTIFVSSVSGSPTITIYDSSSKSTSDPVVLATFVPVAATVYNFFDGLYLSKGLYVVIGGTVSATIGFD